MAKELVPPSFLSTIITTRTKIIQSAKKDHKILAGNVFKISNVHLWMSFDIHTYSSSVPSERMYCLYTRPTSVDVTVDRRQPM